METQKLIEKHAAADGVKDVTVNWRTFSGGGAQTDALLSGNVDIVNTGTGSSAFAVGQNTRQGKRHHNQFGAAGRRGVA